MIGLSRRNPDLFTPEEAAEYLSLETTRTLDWLRENFNLASHQFGSVIRYHREDLDAVVLRACGKDRKQTMPGALRRAG